MLMGDYLVLNVIPTKMTLVSFTKSNLKEVCSNLTKNSYFPKPCCALGNISSRKKSLGENFTFEKLFQCMITKNVNKTY